MVRLLNIIYKFFFLILIILSSSLQAFAAPEIASVSGNLQNGQLITISGSSFGSKPHAAPAISSYDHPTAANNISGGSIGGGWSVRGDTVLGSSSSYRRSSFYQDDYYVNCPYLSRDYSQFRYNGTLSQGNYFYVSFWFYITASDFIVSEISGNSKVWRWYTGDGSIQELYSRPGGGSVHVYRASKDGGQGATDDWTNTWMGFQEWHHVEAWMYCGTNHNTDGFLKTINDGKKARNWTGWGLIGSSTPHNINYFRFGQASGFNHAGGSILLSDVYIDNTQAHVFISDKSDISNWLEYSSVAHNEIQVCSNWSDTSIKFTLNQGTFSGGQTVYLYIVDPNGNINTSGYPITIGGGGTDTTPPDDVAYFNATSGPAQITLTWTNPTDTDFAGVMIRYRTDGTNPQDKDNGLPIPNGNNGKISGSPNQNMSYVHTNLDPTTHYHYSAFSYDTSNNYSQTAYADAQPLLPPSNQAPVIGEFKAIPSSLNNPGETTTFDVSATDPDGDSLTYTINFGDGTANRSGSQVVHTYAAEGTYTAEVSVDDGHGHIVGESLQVTVNDIPPAKPTNVSAN